jgi:hypothetical protein
MRRLATQLLRADEGERGTELFVLDDRGLRDLANFIKGPTRQFDALMAELCRSFVVFTDLYTNQT